jgi:UDP-N-acetylmuramoyl-tripeptide--D-alanyl-D-alanine ligase
LGSMDEIAEAKGELLEHLDEKGVAVLNQDDPYFNFLKEKCSDKFQIFSVSGSSGDIRATNVRWNDEKHIVLDMHIRGEKFTDVKLKTPSLGMMESALAASAAALAVRVPVKSILDGVQRYDGEELRMSIFVKVSGTKVILDCYNANPKSMVDSLKVLSLYKQNNGESGAKTQNGRTIAVLGGMLELGDESQKWHEKVARYILDCGIDIVVSVGAEGLFYHNILTKDSRVQSFHFMTNAEVIDWLKKNTNPDDVVLIKGSRGFKLEEVGKADW